MSFAEPNGQDILRADCGIGDLSNLLVPQSANPRTTL
jgi:hypothetical protein